MKAKEAEQLTLNSYNVILDGINSHIKSVAQRCERSLQHQLKRKDFMVDTVNLIADILRDHGYDVILINEGYNDSYILNISW
jgi:hypothetical protein